MAGGETHRPTGFGNDVLSGTGEQVLSKFGLILSVFIMSEGEYRSLFLIFIMLEGEYHQSSFYHSR